VFAQTLRFEDKRMTQQLRRSEIAVRAVRGVSSRSLKPLALAGLVLAASLALQTAGDAYGEPVTKPQAEIKAAVKKPKKADFHPERGEGSGTYNLSYDGEAIREICKDTGGTYSVFKGTPLCYKN
jgi:hypothetical protein